MTTFTFTSGNAQGQRRIPLYILGALATLVVRRTDRIWVFGSGIGPGEGALPLLRLARQRLGPGVRLVWLATTDRELQLARDLGLDAVPKLSLAGYWLTMRARVLVVTHGQGDVNRYGARGGFLVQLWHGIPLKRLHLDSPVVVESTLLGSRRLGRWVIRRGLRAVGRQISLFPVSSARVAERVTSAFGVRPEHIVITGDPRDDVLLQGTPQDRRAAARATLTGAVGPIDPGSRVVMYAPTWREGDPDPAAPGDAEWDAIVGWLDAVDAVLVVRSHPLGHGDYAGGPERSDRVRLLDAAMIADLTPLLPCVDHLVTDYSSVAYDFALTGGSVVYLTADVLTYTATRGLYEPYRSFSGGRDVAGWISALGCLDELVRGAPDTLALAEEHRRRIVADNFDHVDGAATDRVLAEILRRTAQPGPLARQLGAGLLRGGRVEVVDARFDDVDGGRLRLVIDPQGARAGAFDAAHLDGPRGRTDAVVSRDGDRIVAVFPMTVCRWGTPGLALPSGDYRLVLATGAGVETRQVRLAVPVAGHVDELFRAEVIAASGGVVVRVEPPLTDAERGRAAQRALRRSTAHGSTARGSAVRGAAAGENAVFFESFYGSSASDNPAAIDRALATARPDVTRYWSVADRSVAVPAGAVPLVEFSAEWWRVRARARVLVVNDWLRSAHRPRRGQKVLQTWHGTPLKRLALDRPTCSTRTRLATRVQSWRWDALLAQNEWAAARLAGAYGYRGPVWTTGYPRNDALHDPSRAPAVRHRLGLAADARVVLFVPTWRDDRREIVDHVDLVGFAADLPADTVLLVRGHSRTQGHGRDLAGPQLLDVTTYPDVADLLLVADVLVTDYSSVMFDFAVTGKPMVFFTPDLAHYSDVLRGVYFDLTASAPGELVRDREGLLDAVVHADKRADEYGDRYDAWRQTYAPHDDGRAAERVVRRMLAAGWL